AVQVGHTVVGKDRGEFGPEVLGDPGAFDVQALEVAVEVLAGTVHRAARPGLERSAGFVVAQFGKVGEHREQVQFTFQGKAPQFGAGGQVVGQHPFVVVRVETEQQLTQVTQTVRGALGRRFGGGSGGQVDLDGLVRGVFLLGVFV